MELGGPFDRRRHGSRRARQVSQGSYTTRSMSRREPCSRRSGIALAGMIRFTYQAFDFCTGLSRLISLHTGDSKTSPQSHVRLTKVGYAAPSLVGLLRTKQGIGYFFAATASRVASHRKNTKQARVGRGKVSKVDEVQPWYWRAHCQA